MSFDELNLRGHKNSDGSGSGGKMSRTVTLLDPGIPETPVRSDPQFIIPEPKSSIQNGGPRSDNGSPLSNDYATDYVTDMSNNFGSPGGSMGSIPEVDDLNESCGTMFSEATTTINGDNAETGASHRLTREDLQYLPLSPVLMVSFLHLSLRLKPSVCPSY